MPIQNKEGKIKTAKSGLIKREGRIQHEKGEKGENNDEHGDDDGEKGEKGDNDEHDNDEADPKKGDNDEHDNDEADLKRTESSASERAQNKGLTETLIKGEHDDGYSRKQRR